MAFEWIGDLAQCLINLVPHREIVDTAHGAVKFIAGKKAVALEAGLHWYWPFTTKIIVYPTARQSLDLRTVTTVTSDKVTLLVGGMIVYEIEDIAAILAQTWDVDNTIHDIAIGAVSDVICGRYTYDELMHKRNSGELTQELNNNISEKLKPYGVKVIDTRLPDLCPVKVYKVIGGVGVPKHGDS